MEGVIINFRGGRHTKYTNHMIITIDGFDTREKSQKLLNKPVAWKTPSGKEIKGAIKNVHGNKGAVRAIFERGMPGQSVGTKVSIGA